MLEILFGLIVVAALILSWVSLYDTHHFEVTYKKITDSRVKKSCRFVMLSDLHGQQYGRDNVILLDAIRKENPDGILIAGDMITALKKTKTDKMTLFLKELSQICPVYYANGNHELKVRLYPEQYGDLPERFEKMVAESKVRRLLNEHLSLEGLGICIYGADIAREYYIRMQKVEMQDGYMEEILGSPDKDKYNILLAHNPDFFENYAKWGADLVLSGHVHGGIMRLPFLGGVIAPTLKLFPKYHGGIYEYENAVMVLGRGLGTHSINMRFFNPGELIVLEFEGEN